MLEAPGQRRQRRAFSMVELVVVVIVIGVVAAVAAVAYNQFTGSSRDTAALANARAAATGMAAESARRDAAPETLVSVAVGASTGSAASDALKTLMGLKSDAATLSYPANSARVKVSSGTHTRCVLLGAAAAEVRAGSCFELVNGGFEQPVVYDAPDRPVPYYAAPLTRDTTVAHSGKASLRVDLNSSTYPQGYIGFPATGMTAEPGQKVTSSLWFKGPAGVSFTASGRVELPPPACCGSEGQGAMTFVATGNWQELKVAPWTFTGAPFYPGVQVRSDSPQWSGAFWVDDVSTTAVGN